MIGYIILAAIIFNTITNFVCFIIGTTKGRDTAEAEYAEELVIREKNALLYEQTEREIKEEVLHNAAEQKAELSGHTGARDRFNAINSKLSNKPKN